MKYIHRFNSKLLCSVEMLDRPVAPGENHVLKTTWSQKPAKKHIPEYVRWMHLLNDNYAKEFNMRILHVYQLSPKFNDWQTWAYTPDAPPSRLLFQDIAGSVDADDIDKFNQMLLEAKAAPSSLLFDHQTN